MLKNFFLSLLFLVPLTFGISVKASSGGDKSPVTYINNKIENGSHLNWDIAEDGSVHIYLAYDYERVSLNRAYDHWHFLLEAEAGSDITLIFHNFSEVYNGKTMPFRTWIMDCITSPDDLDWSHVPVEWLEGERMKVKIHMDSDSLYIARVEPYRLSNLQHLIESLQEEKRAKITPIGKTVEGRTLQIIQIGDDHAPNNLFIRARVHPWEAGGNWVVEGIIRTLLDESGRGKDYLSNYAVYILPMANMDGVANGVSRFNMNGMDLNRKLLAPADPVLSPENAAMESWLEGMIARGNKPGLAIDFHNDSNGALFFASAGKQNESYVKNMELLEALLREKTWFGERTSYFGSESFEEGLMLRYGINALVYELNAHWIKSLEKMPLSSDWLDLGGQLCPVFDEYFKKFVGP
jgi:hypothetical protein